MKTKKQFGFIGEEKVKKFLLEKGLVFVCQNFVVRGGEVDLIFYEKDEKILRCVEVKTRSGQSFGIPSPTYSKVKSMRRTMSNVLDAIISRQSHCNDFLKLNREDIATVTYDFCILQSNGTSKWKMHYFKDFNPHAKYEQIS